MDKRKVNIVLLSNAVIWAAVIIGAALALRGTGMMSKLIPILGGGAGASLIIIAGGLRCK
jgi:hypothetical protein